MDNELYSRQADLGLMGPRLSAAIIGCGGVGTWAALALAMGGINSLTLYDADELSEHNRNRLPFPASKVGKAKSMVLAGWLSELRPDLPIKAKGMFDPRLHDLSEYAWTICCTDSLKSRKIVYEAICELRKKYGELYRYLELGADGERWTLSPAPPEFASELEERAGYAITPVHVGPCMMAGAAAAYYVLHDKQPTGSWQGLWRSDKGGAPRLDMSYLDEREEANVEEPVEQAEEFEPGDILRAGDPHREPIAAGQMGRCRATSEPHCRTELCVDWVPVVEEAANEQS